MSQHVVDFFDVVLAVPIPVVPSWPLNGELVLKEKQKGFSGGNLGGLKNTIFNGILVPSQPVARPYCWKEKTLGHSG